MNLYTVELEAVPRTGDVTPDALVAFSNALGVGLFKGPSVSGDNQHGVRVMGQVEAGSANEAMMIGKTSYRTAFKKVFDHEDMDWQVIAVAPYQPDVESIPTPVV